MNPTNHETVEEVGMNEEQVRKIIQAELRKPYTIAMLTREISKRLAEQVARVIG